MRMAIRASLQPQRRLFERFARHRQALAARNNFVVTGLRRIASLGPRAHRPTQTLGRIGSLEVRLAQTAAEVRQAQKIRYRVFYQEGPHSQSWPLVRAARHRWL